MVKCETFYYYKNASAHLCNRQLACSEESFLKLKNKGKITDDRLQLLYLVQRYRALTGNMFEAITGMEKEKLQTELNALTEYGLLIKQFYECRVDEIMLRTETFYCASPNLPEEAKALDTKNSFVWTKELKIEDAMTILSFNQFHIALKHSVPKKALQAQTNYSVRQVMVDGRYRLKSRKFQHGYSHMFAISIRDFAEHNTGIIERLLRIRESYLYGKEKFPWFVLICENKLQCAYINRRLKANPETRDLMVYYILDTDIQYHENPLHYLQTYRFANADTEVRTETFQVEDWY